MFDLQQTGDFFTAKMFAFKEKTPFQINGTELVLIVRQDYMVKIFMMNIAIPALMKEIAIKMG